jgi:hypothetical protein
VIYKRMQAEERYGQEGYKYVGNATYVSLFVSFIWYLANDLCAYRCTVGFGSHQQEPIGYQPPAEQQPPLGYQASAPPAYGSAV